MGVSIDLPLIAYGGFAVWIRIPGNLLRGRHSSPEAMDVQWAMDAWCRGGNQCAVWLERFRELEEE